MRSIPTFAYCVLLLLSLFAVRGLAQVDQPAHHPTAVAVAAEAGVAVAETPTEPADNHRETPARRRKGQRREFFTCSSAYLDRCFDSRSYCYDCSRKGDRIEPPSNSKMLLLQGKFSGMQLYEAEGVMRETYQIRSRVKVRTPEGWDRDGGEYMEIPGWKKVRKGVMECIRTEPIGRTFGTCCGSCSYSSGYIPSVSNPAGLCCRSCSYRSS